MNILSSVHALDACRDEKIWTYGFCFEVDKSFDYKGWMKRTQEFLERNKVSITDFFYRICTFIFIISILETGIEMFSLSMVWNAFFSQMQTLPL